MTRAEPRFWIIVNAGVAAFSCQGRHIGGGLVGHKRKTTPGGVGGPAQMAQMPLGINRGVVVDPHSCAIVGIMRPH